MRLLIVTTSYPRFAGDAAGIFVADAVRALIARGHEAVIIAPDAGPVPPGAEPLAASERVRVHRVRAPFCGGLCYGGGIPENLRRNPLRLLALPFFVHAMRTSIAQEAPRADLIHAHWSVCGWMALPVAKRLGKPLVVTLHGSDLYAKLPLLKSITRIALSGAAGIATASDALRQEALRRGAEAKRVHTIPSGIDILPASPATDAERAATRAAHGLPTDMPLLLFVGRLVAVKQAHLLLAAFAEVRRRGVRAALVLAGDGSERARLENDAARLHLQGQVFFLGNQPHEAVSPLMRSADALTLCSVSEGRPIVLLEALAEGLPVVAHAVGGIPEMVDDGRSGLLVPPGDGAAYADALSRMLSDAAFRTACAEQSRVAFAEKTISWPEHAARLESLYVRCAQAD